MVENRLDTRLKNICANKINQEGKIDIYKEFDEVANSIGLSLKSAGGKITFIGADPIVNSTIALGSGSAIALMLKATAASEIWKERGGDDQDLSVELSKSLCRLSMAYKMLETVNNYCPDNPDTNLYGTVMNFRTKDGRYVIPMNNNPKLRDRMQDLLGCRNSLTSVASSIIRWDSDRLEKAATDQGLIMGKVRSLEEFMNEPVYREYMKTIPLIEIEKIGDSEPEPLSVGAKTPLEGIRALGMGHVMAGAGIGRSLSCYGADVLNIWRLNEYEYDNNYISASMGMRSSRIDYKSDKGLRQVKDLLKSADIFFANRRGALMEELEMTAEDCAKIRPGIIYCNTSFAGDRGPWKDRIGYDQVAGAVTGMTVFEGDMNHPQLPVVNVVNDNIVGWLAAAGVIKALELRSKFGGSYRVHVSLCRASLWLMSMGIFDKTYAASVSGTPGLHEQHDPDTFEAYTPMGLYQGYTDQVKMSSLKESYRTILVPRGSSFPVWLENGVEPKWHPENMRENVHEIDARFYQNKIYEYYDQMNPLIFKLLKILPSKKAPKQTVQQREMEELKRNARV